MYVRPMNFAKNHYHTHRIPETSPCNSEAVLVWCDHVIQHNVLSKTVLLETLSVVDTAVAREKLVYEREGAGWSCAGPTHYRQKQV